MTAPLIGLVAGIVVGLTSTGGGALLTPALMLGLGVPASIAIATDMVVASGMKLVGGFVYASRREVHWATVGRLAIGSVPGALLGVAIVNLVPRAELDAVLRSGLGYVLLLAGVATLVRQVLRQRREPGKMPSLHLTATLGLTIGILVSVTSVGSGSLLLCVLTLFYPLASKTMVGTDLVHALLLTVVSAAGHFAAGRVDVGLAAAVLVGAVPGVLMGARLASAVPDRALRAVLATLLVGIGLHLVWRANGPVPRGATAAMP